MLITYIHSLELLTQYGIKSFYMFLKSYLVNADKSKSAQQAAKVRSDMTSNEEMAKYHKMFIESFDEENAIVPRALRHPKMIKLEQVIITHFKNFEKSKFITDWFF